MDSYQKLTLSAEAASFEETDERPGLGCPSAPESPSRNLRTDHPQKPLHVHRAVLPNGQRLPLLKTLLTSACEKNCYYCFSRSDRDCQRCSFQPREMAETVNSLHGAGVIKGVFLSSGVAGGGIKTQDRLIETAEILRFKLGYRGYIHLKIMPGAEQAQVERAMQLADRVSINLEAPTSERLARLAPQKTFVEELMQPLQWVQQIRLEQPPHRGWGGNWPSSTTQFVVGSADETDFELLRTTDYLYNSLKLARAYYSAFRPVEGTPLEDRPPVDPLRQHRLYQASFLIQAYQWKLSDIIMSESGNLDLEVDPKLAWARIHLSDHPVEINRADYHELLRIPGIGVRSARAIIQARRQQRFTSVDNLAKLGVRTSRALPFLLVNGKTAPRQLTFW